MSRYAENMCGPIVLGTAYSFGLYLFIVLFISCSDFLFYLLFVFFISYSDFFFFFNHSKIM